MSLTWCDDVILWHEVTSVWCSETNNLWPQTEAASCSTTDEVTQSEEQEVLVDAGRTQTVTPQTQTCRNLNQWWFGLKLNKQVESDVSLYETRPTFSDLNQEAERNQKL